MQAESTASFGTLRQNIMLTNLIFHLKNFNNKRRQFIIILVIKNLQAEFLNPKSAACRGCEIIWKYQKSLLPEDLAAENPLH